MPAPQNPLTNWPSVIAALVRAEDLTAASTRWAMGQVVDGSATPAQIAALLVGLAAKGESVEEVSGIADAMLEAAVPLVIDPALREASVDVVGTGGDRAGTVNLSTMAALVVAGAGVPVVKHGNRAASSQCGTADVLAELGVRLDPPPRRVAELVEQVGITFVFAQSFHPASARAAPVRRDLGVPTVFNLLGPLTNPARPGAASIGVASASAAPLVAGVLARRGTRALVVRGDDGLDELTPTGPADLWEVRGGEVLRGRLDPLDLGVGRAPVSALRGGDAATNAAVVRSVLAGDAGPVRDAVLLGAALALVAADPDDPSAPVEERMLAALPRAASSIDSGAAAGVLDAWVSASNV